MARFHRDSTTKEETKGTLYSLLYWPEVSQLRRGHVPSGGDDQKDEQKEKALREELLKWAIRWGCDGPDPAAQFH